MATLTDMRTAVWSAIDGYSDLSTTFNRKWKFASDDTAIPSEITPSIGELPALAIYPVAGETPWSDNQGKTLAYSLQVDLWTARWNVATAEDIWEKIAKAVFQQGSGGTPYVVSATGHYPEIDGFTVERGLIDGGNKATKTSWVIRLRKLGWNPRLSS